MLPPHAERPWRARRRVDARGDYLAVDRNGPAIYYQADNAASLSAALSSTAHAVCCGCVD